MNETSGKVFFPGLSKLVLNKIETKIKLDFPNISVDLFSPPFKEKFSEQDNAEMILRINDFEPNVLFVGMTAPKQEKWSVQHKSQLNCNLVISIGNVIDWYAGTQKAVHPYYFKIRMAWLVRIFLRPEIFKRNIGNQMTFLWHLILMVLRLKRQPTS